MKIKILKTFKWSFSGVLREYTIGDEVNIGDSDASQIILAGYAEEIVSMPQTKMVSIDYCDNNASDINVESSVGKSIHDKKQSKKGK